jgi:hypothetical protein
MTFQSVFGGTPIYPSDVTYLALNLTGNVTLSWPLENAGGTPAARTIDLGSVAGDYTITLPAANQAGAGQTILFNALSSNTHNVTVVDNAGGAVATLVAGKQWVLILADTTTAAGVWRAFQLGASTASVQASALAGYGLVAASNQLSQSMSVTTFSSSPRTVLTTDRAALLVWTGAGTGTLNLPAAATAGNNYFVTVRNGGGGNLTIDPAGAEIINGAATLALSPGDSAILVTDGAVWYSVGLGQNATFAFDFTSISLAASGATYTLSGAELNRVSYKFTGALTTNVAVVVPSTVQQYWIENATTGAFTLTFKTAAGTAVTLAQGARSIYYCNGTNIITADTGGISVPIAVTDGGTGNLSYTAGDILQASGASTLVKLAAVATGNVLISGGVGVVSSWGKVDLTTHVSGALPVTSGGSGVITSTGTTNLVLSASPTLTGVPLAPTAAGGTSTTQIATSAFVIAENTAKAPIASPTFTGIPAAPTAAPATNTTQVASTAFVTAAVAASGGMTYPAAGIANSTGSAWGTSYTISGTGTVLAAVAGPTFTGAPAAPTAAATTNTTQIATTAFVQGEIAAKAPLASPTFTGAPLSTTAAADTNTTQIATTAYVLGQFNTTAGTITMNGTQAAGTSTKAAKADHVHASDTSRAPLASPTFTGVPAAPTAAAATNTTQLATTAFVTAAVAGGGSMVYPAAGIGVSTGSAWGTSLSSTAPVFTTSVTSPIHYGGSTASSTLILRSTSGVGTSDSIQFYTGNNSFAGSFTSGGSLGISGTGADTTALNILKDITGATQAYGIFQQGVIQSGVTSFAAVHYSSASTVAASFTLPTLANYSAAFNTKGAGSVITNHYGFQAGALMVLSAATNTHGFHGDLNAAAGVYNCYMAGTATNYFAGPCVLSAGFTVAGLPAGVIGMKAFVTDATAPTFLGTLTGGGAVKCPVFYNGSAWVAG